MNFKKLSSNLYFKTKNFKNIFAPCFAIILASITATNSLDDTLKRLERNDPTLTEVRFWNFGEPSNKATNRLFKAIEKNSHIKKIEVSIEAGMGADETLGVRLNNSCLKKYSDRVKGGTIIKPWLVKDSEVMVIAKALRENNSLTELCIKNSIFQKKHFSELGSSIRDNHNIINLTLEIDLNANLASMILGNPILQSIDISKNVDLTLPQEDFASFLSQVHNHPTLQTLRIKECGEISLYKADLLIISNLIKIPHYHLKVFDIGFDIKQSDDQYLLRPLVNYESITQDSKQLTPIDPTDKGLEPISGAGCQPFEGRSNTSDKKKATTNVDEKRKIKKRRK